MDKEKLHENLTMEHLSVDALKEEIDGRGKKPTTTGKDPRKELEYTFFFKWVDDNGKSWDGEFTNRILSIREMQSVGIMRSRLGGGVPIDSLDTTTSDINLMVSHLTYSLKVRPDWAQDLLSLTEIDLLYSIYQEVLAHEGFFRGRNQNQD